MKARNSFVSNSSSSSFVIAFDPKKKASTVCPTCHRGYEADSLESVISIIFDKNDDDFSFDVFDEGHVKTNDWYTKEEKDVMLEKMKSGKMVAKLTFNMHRDDAHKEYRALIDSKAAEHIRGDSD